jgi:hypothetical protein
MTSKLDEGGVGGGTLPGNLLNFRIIITTITLILAPATPNNKAVKRKKIIQIRLQGCPFECERINAVGMAIAVA